MKLAEKHIDALIDIWHTDANILCELWEFLGWSRADYSTWVKTPAFEPESNLDEAELAFIFRKKGTR